MERKEIIEGGIEMMVGRCWENVVWDWLGIKVDKSDEIIGF